MKYIQMKHIQKKSAVSLFDKLAVEYDAWFDKEGSQIFPIEVQAFRGVLGSLPKPWLEVGVGSGRFAQALGITTGIDLSPRLLEMARQRGINVYLGKGEEQIYKAASFGSIFLIVTLCFVDSVHEVLKEAYRILVPHGKIVLGLVLKGSPWCNYYEINKLNHRFYKYATFYEFEEVKTMLKEAGFFIEEVVSTLFQKPYKVEHLESPRKGFSKDAGFVVIVAGKDK
ncbi:class I SAM-dependent methyltransferase [Chloroflexota bacterium]